MTEPPLGAGSPWNAALGAGSEASFKAALCCGDCRLARCRHCDLTQVVDRIPAAQLRSIYGPDYFSHEKYRDREALRRENRSRLRLVQRFVQGSDARILEAGCGTGDFMSIAKHAYDISGFDLSLHAVNIARRTNLEIADDIWCRDLDEVELPDSHFDAVCLWDVVEHVWDFHSVCQKLMASLKPGGFLFLSTPDSGSWAAERSGDYWPLMTPPEHVSFFSDGQPSPPIRGVFKIALVYSAARGKWVNVRFALRKIQE